MEISAFESASDRRNPRAEPWRKPIVKRWAEVEEPGKKWGLDRETEGKPREYTVSEVRSESCLLYTSDAADDWLVV